MSSEGAGTIWSAKGRRLTRRAPSVHAATVVSSPWWPEWREAAKERAWKRVVAAVGDDAILSAAHALRGTDEHITDTERSARDALRPVRETQDEVSGGTDDRI